MGRCFVDILASCAASFRGRDLQPAAVPTRVKYIMGMRYICIFCFIKGYDQCLVEI